MFLLIDPPAMFARRLVLLCSLLLLSAGSSALADDYSFPPIIDYTINDSNGDGHYDSVNTTATSLDIIQLPGIRNRKSITTFHIADVPAGAQISSVSFTYSTLFTTGNAESRVNFLWTPGTTVSTADATIPGTLLATHDIFAIGFGRFTVSLGPTAISTIMQIRNDGGTSYPIRLEAFGNLVNHGLMSTEWSVFESPRLNITTVAVPEPAQIAGLAGILVVSCFCLYHYRKRKAIDQEVANDLEAE